MKPNVDLSENRLFTTYREPSELTGTAKIILDWLKKSVRKPWDFENNPTPLSSDLDLEILDREELILTGNKQQRQRKRLYRLYDEGTVCDICGLDTRKKPWAGMTCSCYSMVHQHKFPWIF